MSGLRYGAIPGIPVGAQFDSYDEMHAAGLHRTRQAGIAGGKDGSDSIVVKGGYTDDRDYGDRIIYTGQGGRKPGEKKHSFDQTLTLGNAGLMRAYADGEPVRVIRGKGGDPKFSPAQGYRYDGLFRIVTVWSETNPDGFLIWCFELVKDGTKALRDAESTPKVARRRKARRSSKAGKRTAMVTVRDGQGGFRDNLREKYGDICAVTGPCPAEALDAAHLRGFADYESHDIEGGVLLRADVHRLFDSGLLAVDVRGLQVEVAPSIAGHPVYGAFAGQKLAIPEKLVPNLEALMEHHAAATASWG